MVYSKTATSGIPLLPEKHSGIPVRLIREAQQKKSLFLEARTKIQKEGQRLPAVPPGIEYDEFLKALNELSNHIGENNIEIVDKHLDDGWYIEHPNTHDAMSPLDENELEASAVVYPGSSDEVQKIVLWANTYKIPISPISIGRNFGYGGAAPRVRGSVVVDLGRRMNKILDINPNDCTCLVEPGVTYFALYEKIQARGYKNLWVDVPDLGGGSVIGNALDRGVGYTPYGDHWGMHSGLEVVLPTGELIRTGMGALPGNNSWQIFPYGFGPYSDGLFSQSNLGIVTKMGMALMPNPGGHESFMYAFRKEEDLAQLAETIRPLRIANILENVAQIRHVAILVAQQGKPKSTYFQGEGQVPDDVLREASKALPIGECYWVFFGTTYGPKKMREYKLEVIHKEFMKVPGARQIDPATLPKEDYFWTRDQVASGIPGLEELAWVNWHPNGSHIAFSPVSPARGPDAMKLWNIAKRRGKEFGVDLFLAFLVGVREMHLIVEAVFDRKDLKGRKAAYECMRVMIDDAAQGGYGEYRTHLVLMDQVAGTYNWNDGSLMKFNERIKDALDPNGILAPGKSGVWPAKYRGHGWQLMKERGKTSEGYGIDPGSSSAKL